MGTSYKERNAKRRTKGLSKFQITRDNCEELGNGLYTWMEKPENQGKTAGEALSDENILGHLEVSKVRIEALQSHMSKVDFKKEIKIEKEELKLDIAYLKKIGRLPKEFEDFNVNSLK